MNKSEHRPEGVVLDEIVGCGRGLVADRDFEFGETVFESPPILHTGAQAVEDAVRMGTLDAFEKQLQTL